MKIVINPEYSSLESFVNDLHDNFDSSGEAIHDSRNTIKIIYTPEGKRLVVKRYKRPNIINRFAYTLVRGTKAKRAYHNAFKLLEKGIETPIAIAYVDVHKGALGLVDTSYLVTEYTDAIGLKEVVNEKADVKLKVLDGFISFIIDVHSKGVRHLDLTYTNCRYKVEDDGSVNFCLIDINRMKFQKMTRRRSLLNLRRLCESDDFRDRLAIAYAEKIGWDVDDTLEEFIKMHTDYHRKRELRQGLKRKLLPNR